MVDTTHGNNIKMKAANTDPKNLALAAAGSLAGGVAAELRVPLRELREGLAVIVEILDQHLNEHEGPAPYPWTETKALRE